MAEKKRKHFSFTKLIFILIILVLLVFALVNTRAKYESDTNSVGNANIAFYVLGEDIQTMNINLFSMVPREQPYVKTFTISNNDGTHRAETATQYNLQIITTTNLPLKYELYLNQNYTDPGAADIIAASQQIAADSDGTYFNTITAPEENFGYTADESNTYTLVIYFPVQYISRDYQDIIESISVVVDSKQVI